MTRQEIMKEANIIINALVSCDDSDFVDNIIFAICNGEEFTEEEMEENY